MKIQIISHDGMKLCDSGFVCTKFSEPQSLDEFDIIIVDLGADSLWRSTSFKKTSVNDIDDLSNLQVMMENSFSSLIVIILPQDLTFLYNKSKHSRGYNNKIKLKNCLEDVKTGILSKLIPRTMPVHTYELLYENTITEIGDIKYEASFYFVGTDKSVTSSRKSKKPTTIQNDRVILTTLDILESETRLLAFLRECKAISSVESYPQWLMVYSILNDDELNDIVKKKKAIIEAAESEINNANFNIQENLEYKSILYTNGADLVNVVIRIFEKLLALDLSDISDDKKEDFLIMLDNYFELIGEIKGVTSNVKSEHISQLDVHYQKRLDVLREENEDIETKAIFVINPLRTTPVNEREAVNAEQINLATRNGSLIITTEIFLKIFEHFVADAITTESCIEMFRNEKGLLKEKAIKKYCSTK